MHNGPFRLKCQVVLANWYKQKKLIPSQLCYVEMGSSKNTKKYT